MQKPTINLDDISFGKIFQISPEGQDPIQIRYGGDFLIGTSYEEWGVVGYLATVHEQEEGKRNKGISYLRVPWVYLECVGSVEWFKQNKEENERTDDNRIVDKPSN